MHTHAHARTHTHAHTRTHTRLPALTPPLPHSMRSASARYTAWFPWNQSTLKASWDQPYAVLCECMDVRMCVMYGCVDVWMYGCVSCMDVCNVWMCGYSYACDVYLGPALCVTLTPTLYTLSSPLPFSSSFSPSTQRLMINEHISPHTHTHTHTHINIYKYIYICTMYTCLHTYIHITQ